MLPPINGGLHCGVDAFNRYRKTLTVLPPINGGLHCGTTVGEVAACTEGGAPAYQRRAPLRHVGPEGRAAARHRAPAYQRRAPLRQLLVRPAQRAPLECSRLSTAGSIAARVVLRRRDGDHRVCSRLSTAGSIAAKTPGSRRPGPGQCSRLSTAGSIAAPSEVATWAAKCSRLSTAGSIAARWSSRGSRRLGTVLPPINGGLHCGFSVSVSCATRSSSAPAYQINGGLHCGKPRLPR